MGTNDVAAIKGTENKNCQVRADKYALTTDVTMKKAFKDSIFFKIFQEADKNHDGKLSENEINYYYRKKDIETKANENKESRNIKSDFKILKIGIGGILALIYPAIKSIYNKPLGSLGKLGILLGTVSLGFALAEFILKNNKDKDKHIILQKQLKTLDSEYNEKILADAQPVTVKKPEGVLCEKMKLEEAYHDSTSLHLFNNFDMDRNGVIDADEYKYYKYIMELQKEKTEEIENTTLKSFVKSLKERIIHFNDAPAEQPSWASFKKGLLPVKPSEVTP